MDKNSVIEVNNLSKKYGIGKKEKYLTFRETLIKAIQFPRQLFARKKRGQLAIWALKDISFKVQKGEVLGIIGRNGAGKTTLLKILSRITEPTKGEVAIRGRIASLLEVGTGFHPELTGRENIYLNGSILGMKKKEIDLKFNAIAEFSGVKKFLDTPMKRYSSGMFVRLAFSVAAHLEPEILLIDEVLAVGDAEFQKKCLGKMDEVTKTKGRTVLFVSHNMGAIQNLCQRCILLDQGRIKMMGEAKKVVVDYLASTSQIIRTSLRKRRDRKGNQQLMIRSIEMRDKRNKPLPTVFTGQEVYFHLCYEAKREDLKRVIVSLDIDTPEGQRVVMLSNNYSAKYFNLQKKEGKFVCRVPKLSLNQGQYTGTVFITVNGEISDWVRRAFNLTVEDGDFYGRGKNPDVQDGSLLMEHDWFCQ